MTTLRDLVLEVQEAAVVEGIARFYDQHETQWLPDAVADVLGQLRNLAPPTQPLAEPVSCKWSVA